MPERRFVERTVYVGIGTGTNAHSPLTGYGSNLTITESVECDASLMEGSSKDFGAVGAVHGLVRSQPCMGAHISPILEKPSKIPSNWLFKCYDTHGSETC